RPPSTPPFPYTTLFRSPLQHARQIVRALRPVKPMSARLALVVDDSPSMRVWRPTTAAFLEMIERSAVFRQVSRHDLGSGLELSRSEEHTSELQSLRHLV